MEEEKTTYDNVGNENFKGKLLIGIIILLVASNLGMFYFYQKSLNNISNVVDDTQTMTQNPLNQEVSLDDDLDALEEKELEINEILVDWNEEAVEVDDIWTIIDSNEVEQIMNDMKENSQTAYFNFEHFEEYHQFYEVGKIENSDYLGARLYIVRVLIPGMGAYPVSFNVIKIKDDLIYLSKNAFLNIEKAAFKDVYKNIFQIDNVSRIINLESPQRISIPESDSSLLKTMVFRDNYSQIHGWLSEYIDGEKSFEYQEEKYVYRKGNCFIVGANDGTVRGYHLDLNFAKEMEERSHYLGAIPYLLDFKFSNGEQNQNEYIFQSGGHFHINYCYNYAHYINNDSQLSVIGYLDSGELVYVLKDINTKERVQDQNSILQTMYDMYYPGYNSETQERKEKVSFEEFLEEYPLIFVKDPFGDYIEMKNAKYLPAVEMGKPVIYLYPETEMDISVQVEPKGGFSITEPTYNNGWLVKANPNGELFNYADKEIYPYLFWEGFGINYQRSEQGFVVAKENVEKFLENKLAYLGLVRHEYDEFIEFWLPKMQEQDYYFITFVPQSEFDLLAPLTVEPKPDIVIRVFMDYEGLDNYMEVPEQTLQKGVREGFTVIEWGGALHR